MQSFLQRVRTYSESLSDRRLRETFRKMQYSSCAMVAWEFNRYQSQSSQSDANARQSIITCRRHSPGMEAKLGISRNGAIKLGMAQAIGWAFVFRTQQPLSAWMILFFAILTYSALSL